MTLAKKINETHPWAVQAGQLRHWAQEAEALETLNRGLAQRLERSAQRNEHEREAHDMLRTAYVTAATNEAAKAKRARKWVGVLCCVIVGLVGGLIYAGAMLNAQQPPCIAPKTAPASDVMELKPSEIRARKNEVYEI